MSKYEQRWLVAFARRVRRGEPYSHWDCIDAVTNSLTGKLIWC